MVVIAMKKPTLDGMARKTPVRGNIWAGPELCGKEAARPRFRGQRALAEGTAHAKSCPAWEQAEGREAGTVVEGTWKEMGQRSRLRPDYLGPLLAARTASLEKWSLVVGRNNTFRKTLVCSNLESIPNIYWVIALRETMGKEPEC